MFPEFDLFTHTFISQLFRKLLPLTECFLTPQQPPADESIDMIRRTAQQKHAGDQSQIDNIDMKINENLLQMTQHQHNSRISIDNSEVQKERYCGKFL